LNFVAPLALHKKCVLTANYSMVISTRVPPKGGLLGNPEQSFDDLKDDAAIDELAIRFAYIPAEEFSKRWRLARATG